MDLLNSCTVVDWWKDAILQERLDTFTKLRAEGSALVPTAHRARSLRKGRMLASVSADENSLLVS